MANCVLAISCRNAAAAIVVALAISDVGGVGKSATGIVGICDSKRSADTVTCVPSFDGASFTSPSGSARTIS